MKRLIPLLAAVLVLALSGTAAADTFRVVRPHSGGAPASVSFSSSGGGPAIAFTHRQDGPMSFEALRGIWQAAGNAYGIPWQVLAAINKVETNFGQNLGPSSAGAIGWMQFMPSTWASTRTATGRPIPTTPPTPSSAPPATSPAAADSSTSRARCTATTTRPGT
jgi:hypothetical protein